MAGPATVQIDSRKFLGILNDSAQAKVTFFEDRISQMGQQAKKNWRLTALYAKNLYFEDVDTNTFFVADHIRESGGKVNISNIQPIEIIEKEKQSLFGESCEKLVSAIEENDQKAMQSAFNRMRAQRFSGRIVPYSGVIRGRDNVTRKITVSTGESLDESARSQMIAAIVESLHDRVIVENGQVVSGHFVDGDEISLPVTKWAGRKLVAKRMREAANNAYWSEGFQKRIQHVARLVSESKIQEAVKSLTPFLDDQEEFTLLSRVQIQTLVENSLAANAVFNDQLCKDTATLFYRTNLQINRDKIIGEWRNIAKKAEHPVLAENVQILENATNFEAALDKFLNLIFEAISNKAVAAEALATTLSSLKEKTPKIRESHDLSSKLDNLITRLKQTDFDDAAIYEAEDLIATIQEELAATETLSNFDQMPGGEEDLGLDVGDVGGGEGTPVININSPLIQVGGQSSAGGGAEEVAAEAPPEMPPEAPPEEENPFAAGGESGEDELAAILGGAGGGMPEGKTTDDTAISESRPVHYEMKDEDDDDDASDDCPLDESVDPYAIKKDELELAESSTVMTDYGAPVITDTADLQKVVRIMDKLATEHNLMGQALSENLESMAQAGIKAIGLRIPTGRLQKAVTECVELFLESDKPFPGAAAPFGSNDSDSDDSDNSDSDNSSSGKPWENSDDSDSDNSDSGKPWENDDDEGVAEDQLHGPRIPARGYGKSSYEPRTLKKGTTSESVEWGESQADGIMGDIGGVKFIFDHGGNSELKPVILSEDGSVEIPIPENLYESAFASAGMSEGDGNSFLDWLNGSVEQLRPISEDEDEALNEAMATITTTPEGGITVEVSDDVEVGDVDDGGMGVDDEMDTAGMAPVDSVGMDDGMDDGMGADPGMEEMPDFEGGADMGAPEGGPESAGAPPEGPGGAPESPDAGLPVDDEEEEGMPFEDKDITQPQSSKYGKHVKENPRDMPAHKPTKKTDDKLEGVGPDLKQDDGTGTKPPTAKSASNE